MKFYGVRAASVVTPFSLAAPGLAWRPGNVTTHHPGEAALRMADIVVAATPCDLAQLIEINKPMVRAHYEFEEAGEPRLGDLIEAFLDKV